MPRLQQVTQLGQLGHHALLDALCEARLRRVSSELDLAWGLLAYGVSLRSSSSVAHGSTQQEWLRGPLRDLLAPRHLLVHHVQQPVEQRVEHLVSESRSSTWGHRERSIAIVSTGVTGVMEHPVIWSCLRDAEQKPSWSGIG